jgi:poly[(R)-3-hydroxyalkanoate] polymerase subunit PhaC
MESNKGSPARAQGMAAAAMDPTGMLESAADLLSPISAARELPWLGGEAIKIALGQSDITMDPKDRKFGDTAWQENLVYRRIGQSYKLFEQLMGRLVDAAPGDWERKSRARYLANIITGAASPTNFLATNPVAVKRAFDTGGLSLVRGAWNMVGDLARGGMPTMVDRRPFPVGEKLACSPGAVVYRDEIFELLQYAPATPEVRSRPLLMVPPQLNRYYVLDLSPGRSMVEYMVGQGIQPFMMAWRNPRGELGHGQWGLDDYFAAMSRALDVTTQISGSEDVNLFGLCAGGITAALFLGYLAAQGDTSVHALTLLVTLLTGNYANVLGQFDTPGTRDMLRQAASRGLILPGDMLRTTFAWLRPDDLVFNYMVSGWLLGEQPHAFDVLAWNDDATAVTAKLGLECSELVVEGRAAKPGGVTVLGTPIDLSKVSCDSFHVGGYTDHITPWRACYDSSRLLGGSKEMVVVKSGHIQSFVNPVKNSRYDYWDGTPAAADPDEWLATATFQHGSWWPRWIEWVVPRSGAEGPAPAELGSAKHPPLGPAPGTYVHG